MKPRMWQNPHSGFLQVSIFVKRDYRVDGFGIKNKLGGKFVFHATFCYFCSINVLEPFYTQYGAYFTQRFG